MMPKAASVPPKAEVGKLSKKENKSAAFSVTLPLINGIGSSHTSIAVPTDSKTFQFDLDTNIDIKMPITSRLSSSCLVTSLLSSFMFAFVIFFWLEANYFSQQIHVLENNLVLMSQEIALISENYLVQKLLVDEISERFDASRTEHCNCKSLVERETHTTPGHESIDYFSETVTNSPESMTEILKNGTTDSNNVPENIFKKYDPEIQELDVMSETSTEYFGDSSSGSQRDYDEESNLSESQRSPRNKRSNGRGKEASKKRKQSLRGPNIKNNISNTRKANRISAVHFKGGYPETVIHDGGSIKNYQSLIAPWFRDVNATDPFGLSRFQLKEGNATVQVSDAGLYYVYAQVYYLTNETINSYSINLRKTDGTVNPLAYCSANASLQGRNSFTDVSCFTSVVRYLKIGDQISLQQGERYRRILMKEGQTFLGLVRLEHEKSSVKM